MAKSGEVVEEGSENAAQRLHIFDPWLTSPSRVMSGMASNVATSYQHATGSRQRRIKAADDANLKAILEAVWTNLAFVIASGHSPASMAVSLRAAKQKHTRYTRREFNHLSAVLDLLSPEYLLLNPSKQRGQASRVTARVDKRMATFFDAPWNLLKDFSRLPGAEAIILSRAEGDHAGYAPSGDLVDYEDCAEAGHFRSEMAQVNDYLASATLAFEPDDAPPVATGMRSLWRCFLVAPDDDQRRFDLGGRLFGGWWQNLPASRRGSIRINREPVADLDFSDFYLRLAYLSAGVESPKTDPYAAIEGLSEPRWREGVKAATSAMLFASEPLRRLPSELKDMLPPRTSRHQVREAIRAAHPALGAIFEAGRGPALMFTASQIMVASVLALNEAKIIALPLHEGVMVARSKANAAGSIMRDAAEKITGQRLPVALRAEY